MPKIQIVTDSTAHFTSPHFAQQYPGVTIVPNRITIGGRTYREGVDLGTDEALRLIGGQPYAPLVHAPTEADFLQAYQRISKDADAIISIHATREMYTGYAHALAASRQMAGQCPVAVVDSRTLCVGQGMLVRAAAQSAQSDQSLDDIVRQVRGAADRVYSIYYVESVHYLMQNKILSPSHGLLSSMLGIKPVLGIEHGRLLAIEKVRTRAQAVDRLYEFVSEFGQLDDVVIIQARGGATEQTRMLQERLTAEFVGQQFPYTTYGASLAALIGTDASGVVVLEGDEPEDAFEDEF